MLSFALGKDSISLFLDDGFHTINKNHINFDIIEAELRKRPEERNLDVIRENLTVKKSVLLKTAGAVEIYDDAIYYKGDVVSNYMTTRMFEILEADFDITPWAQFMDNLYQNPNPYVCEELYEWMEKGKMPITPDGYLLAFKKVRTNYKDCHTGKFDNSAGSLLEMPREQCDSSRKNACSTGFHFCSVDYLSMFGGSRVMVVKINPRDVTSIPDDADMTKGRCCRYEVIGELKNQTYASDPMWQKTVVDLDTTPEVHNTVIGLVKNQPPAMLEEQVELAHDKAAAKVEEETTDAGKAKDNIYFTTSDGTVYSDKELIRAINVEGSIRAAAKYLSLAESTLRGWKKKLGL